MLLSFFCARNNDVAPWRNLYVDLLVPLPLSYRDVSVTARQINDSYKCMPVRMGGGINDTSGSSQVRMGSAAVVHGQGSFYLIRLLLLPSSAKMQTGKL